MALVSEHNQQRGSAIRSGDIVALQEDSRRRPIIESTDIRPEETGRGVALFLQNFRSSSTGEGMLLGAVQTDITGSANVVSVKSCDANGVTSGDAFNVYIYAGQGYWNPTAVTVANTSATATCKLAAGKIIGYAYSGSDAYMLGDVAQVLKDWWVDGTSGKVIYAVYWRVGQAVSTVSNVEGPDTRESDYVPCS